MKRIHGYCSFATIAAFINTLTTMPIVRQAQNHLLIIALCALLTAVATTIISYYGEKSIKPECMSDWICMVSVYLVIFLLLGMLHASTIP